MYYNYQRLFILAAGKTGGFNADISLQHSRKLGYLKNKAYFFYGQVNPLQIENKSLKYQLVANQKLISASTELLRNLLPVMNDPNKKLKLEMASLYEICDVIKMDWHDMEHLIETQAKSIKALEAVQKYLYKRYEECVSSYERQISYINFKHFQYKTAYECTVSNLYQNIQTLIYKHYSTIQQMNEELERRSQCFDKIEREYDRYQRDMAKKCQYYDRCVYRLQGEMTASLAYFEYNKKTLRDIYNQLMEDKLKEQADTFESLVNMKEAEKNALIRDLCYLEEEKRKQSVANEKTVANLEEKNHALKLEIDKQNKEIEEQALELNYFGKKVNKLIEQNNQLAKENSDYLELVGKHAQILVYEKKKLAKTVEEFTMKIYYLIRQGYMTGKSFAEQKKELYRELAAKYTRLKQTLQTLAKYYESSSKKIATLTAYWYYRELQLKLYNEKALNELQEYCSAMRQYSEKSLQALQAKEKEIEQILTNNYRYKYRINKLAKEKLTQLQEEDYSRLKHLKMTHHEELNQATLQTKYAMIAANYQMRQMTIQCNNKLMALENKKEAEKYILIKYLTDKLLKITTLESSLKQNYYQFRKQEQIIEALQEYNRAKYRQQQYQHEQYTQRLKDYMLKQMIYFQLEMYYKEKKYYINIKTLKTNMYQYIKLLKQNNALYVLEEKHQEELMKMKQSYNEQMSKIEHYLKGQIELICERHAVYLARNNYAHLMEIAQLYSITNTTWLQLLNRLYLDPTYYHSEYLLKLSLQYRNTLTYNKINKLKYVINNKDVKIVQLYDIINLKKLYLYTLSRSIDYKVREKKEYLYREKQFVIKYCRNKVENIISECRAKITAAYCYRLQHSQNLYKYFNLLKQQHDNYMYRLHNKYNYLYHLFYERPSRAEDLSKIKYLINIQSQLDNYIFIYHRKMEKANEIVKYLHLELENYKDVYNIFGPNYDKAVSPALSPTNYSLISLFKSHQQQQDKDKQDEVDSPIYRKGSLSHEVHTFKVFEDKNQSDSKRYHKIDVNQLHSPERYRRRLSRPDKESEIIVNAENFIKLINNARYPTISVEKTPYQPSLSVYKPTYQPYRGKKNYRKRVSRRVSTMGISITRLQYCFL